MTRQELSDLLSQGGYHCAASDVLDPSIPLWDAVDYVVDISPHQDDASLLAVRLSQQVLDGNIVLSD